MALADDGRLFPARRKQGGVSRGGGGMVSLEVHDVHSTGCAGPRLLDGLCSEQTLNLALG